MFPYKTSPRFQFEESSPIDLSQPSSSSTLPSPVTPMFSDEGSQSQPESNQSRSQSRKKSKPIPEALKDERYFMLRARNNESARKSRNKSRDIAKANAERVQQLQERVKVLETENQVLHVVINDLSAKIKSLLGNPLNTAH